MRGVSQICAMYERCRCHPPGLQHFMCLCAILGHILLAFLLVDVHGNLSFTQEQTVTSKHVGHTVRFGVRCPLRLLLRS